MVDPLPDDAPFFVKDYHDYYKTPRGYHPRSLGSTEGWNTTSALSLLNTKLLAYADEIRSAVLMIHGDKSQGARQHALDSFKKGKIMALVATDIAARGIDVAALPSVVNYELPVST